VTNPSTNSVKTGDPTLEEHARLQRSASSLSFRTACRFRRDGYLPDTQIESVAAWVVGRRLSVHRD